MSSFARRFPEGTLVVRTILYVTSVVSSHPGKTVECDAIWDTGANASAVSLAMARKLGLKPVRTAFVSTANGRCEMPMYMVDVILPNGDEIKDVMVSGMDLAVCDALVGMDIITRGDFHLTNDGGLLFQFRMPPASEGNDTIEGK